MFEGDGLAVSTRTSESMDSTNIDLNEVVACQKESFQRHLGGRIQLQITTSDRPARISLHDGLVGQLLTGLLEQARELLPGGGRYHLDADALQDACERGIRFLQKPYNMRQLLETVQAAITGPSPCSGAGDTSRGA
jgi:hypothetical protein